MPPVPSVQPLATAARGRPGQLDGAFEVPLTIDDHAVDLSAGLCLTVVAEGIENDAVLGMPLLH